MNSSNYIAMLRGINVSGQKKIKMVDLKNSFETAGYKNVRTYIQSGNVAFESEVADKAKLEDEIEAILLRDFNFEIPVVVRNHTDFEQILNENPYIKQGKDPARLCVTFFKKEPEASRIGELGKFHFPPEEYVISGMHLFFHSPNGFGRAKMSNNFFEQKLKVKATSRNWKTVNVLAEMCA